MIKKEQKLKDVGTFNKKPVPTPRTKKIAPIPAPRTQITQIEKALKGYTKSFEISLKTDKDPLVHLQNTRLAIERLFGKIILNDMKGFKFVGVESYLHQEKR